MSKSFTPWPSAISSAGKASGFRRARPSLVVSMKRALSRDEVGAAKVGWGGETPLWYCIQREADVRCGGNRLGPVGARIVGEVLVGILNLDPASVRHAPDDWRPTASLIQLLEHA